MKQIKILISLLLIFIGFLLIGELNLSYIDNFASEVPNTTIYFQPGMDQNIMIRDVIKSAEKHKISFFLVKNEIVSNNSKNIILYTSSIDAEQMIKSEKMLRARSYNSIFTGEVTVSFKSYKDIPTADLEKNSLYYAFGERDNIHAFKMDLIDKYAGNHPQFPNNTNTASYTVIGIWSLIFFVFLLLTVFYIQAKKREVFLKVIYGESRIWIFLKESVIDSIFIIGGAFLIQYLLKGYTESYFCSNFFYIEIIVFAILNTTLYIAFTSYKSKTIYGRQLQSTISLSLLYLLKAVSMALVALLLTSNVLLATESLSFLSQESFFKDHSEYNYVNIGYIPREDRFGRIVTTMDKNAKTKESFYQKNYLSFQPILIAELGQMQGRDLIYANEYALDYLKKTIPTINTLSLEQKCYYFFPKPLSNNEGLENMLDLTMQNFILEEGIKDREVIYYSEKAKVINIDELSPLYSKISTSPIIVLDNRPVIFEESKIVGNHFFTTVDRSILYRINESEFAQFVQEHDLEAEIHGTSNIYDVYLHGKRTMQRILKMAIVFTGLFILLETLILLTIIKLEFRMFANYISLQKIFGYAKFERYKRLFSVSLMSTALAEAIFLVVNIVYGLYPMWWGTLMIGLVLILELFLMNIEIRKLENRNIPLVLKGEFR